MSRRIVLLLAFFASVLAAVASSAPAQATCTTGQISVKPLVVRLPECYPPGGGPGGG